MLALENRRAQGRPGARCTRGLVRNCTKQNAHEHTGSAEAVRPSLRDGVTAYFELSLVTGLSCHHRRADIALEPIGSMRNCANLTPASGRQDHTTSPYASVPFVKGTSASTASHRAFRDDREPPLSSGETGESIEMICPTG